MRNIKIIAFKGCLPALKLHDTMKNLIAEGPSRFTLSLDIVPSPHLAKKMGLYGSPTILANKKEYQAERRGPASFY
ncbi:hypothetical protein [Desulfovibrio ferrophilus]|nr:hypothetical protein [Desulfovibrio ferrophilus]